MADKKKIAGLVTGLVAVVAAAIFLTLGVTLHLWHIAWLVFLAVPVTAIISDIVINKTAGGDSLVGLVAVAAAAVYLVLGFTTYTWHISWVVFLAIPITAIIVQIVKAAKKGADAPQQADAQQTEKTRDE